MHQVALQLWLPPSFLVDAFSVAAQVNLGLLNVSIWTLLRLLDGFTCVNFDRFPAAVQWLMRTTETRSVCVGG